MIRLLGASAALALFASGCPKPPSHPSTPDSGPPACTEDRYDGATLAFIADPARADAGCDWPQWGQNWGHTGASCVPGQSFASVLGSITFDPFVALEVAEAQRVFGSGDLLAHFGSPLVVGDDLYLGVKTGTYVSCEPANHPVPCGLDAWDQQIWTVQHHAWASGALTLQQAYASDWKPPPWQVVQGWEPVFQAAVHDQVVWIPGGSGTVVRLDRQLGGAVTVNPFGTLASNRYLTGPLVVDADGALLYNVVELDAANPQLGDSRGYLVRVPPGVDATHPPTVVDYQSIAVGASAPTDLCPPATTGQPVPCGSQRPGFNSGPAIGPDGVIFVVSRSRYAQNDSALVALNPDLSPRWTFRMREILCDGCGVLVSCRPNRPPGVDPNTGLKGSIWVNDESSSVPVALPDGAVLYGGLSSYYGGRGHLIKVSPDGRLMGHYDFGWDSTPAVWLHDGTYSIVTKDNHYPVTPDGSEGPYDMTQLSRDLIPEWSFASTETRSCVTDPDGGVSCVSDHPSGFEWCVNAPAVAPDGTVYANSEDGRVYAIRQGGVLGEQRFLLQSLGAAYTPIVIDSKGRIYSMNGGLMTVVGQ